ncbi:hypothetical protein [Beijerinckia mobilis]|uniref:hypothetical protein n=1 Tax=Beijerinckia mobilis TaxID=231434 RepID=UPI0012EC34C7|nr:hypothetical protein [Beijerinckia mobilis]
MAREVQRQAAANPDELCSSNVVWNPVREDAEQTLAMSLTLQHFAQPSKINRRCRRAKAVWNQMDEFNGKNLAE